MIALDILLEPGEAMVKAARVANARLRARHSGSFAIDDSHVPHITVLQTFVSRCDLDRIAAALAGVIDTACPTRWRLRATGLDVSPYGEVGLAFVAVERTPELAAFQDAVVKAMTPYARPGGDAGCFVPSEDGGAINPLTIQDARAFVPRFTGANYSPHVTIGISGLQQADSIEAPFRPFAFDIVGVAVYQLGDYGAARRKLWPGLA